MEKESKQGVIKKWHMFVLVGAISILLIFGGYLYYSSEEKSIRGNKYQEIHAVAELKISQIIQWRKERFGDATIATQAPFFNREIKQWFGNKKNLSLKKDLLKRFTPFIINYRYEDIFLASPQGGLLLSLNPKEKTFDTVTSSNIREVIKKQQITFTDFYYCPAHKKIHFDIIAPVIDDKNISIAAMLFRIDPNDYLYPLIQAWPTPSKTAETLLLRRDGDSVLFLNDIRHRKNTALKLRIPLTQKEDPAVQAVLGYKEIWEGTDYRGVQVLSDIQAILGTPWFMVAKVDESEIHSELTFKAVFIGISTLVLILLSGAGLAWIYYSRQRNIYRELFVKEKVLREAHEEFKTILYSIGDGVITTNNNGVVKKMNSVAEQLTGWSESDAKGKLLEDIFQIVSEKTRNKVENPVKRVLREGMVIGLANHTLLISKDGKEIPVADSGAPIRDEQGEIEGVVLVFRDKTEEQKAEKLIRDSEAKLKRAEFVSKAGNWELHLDSKIMITSEGTAKIYGIHGGQFDYSAIKEILLPEDRPMLDNALRKLIENGEPYDLEFKIKNAATGKILDIHSVAEYDKENKILFGVIQDITERKKAEEALRESQKNFKDLFDNAPIGYHEIDTNGNIIRINKTELKMLGYSEEEMLGKPIWKFVENEEMSWQAVLAKLSGKLIPHEIYERTFNRKDGSKIAVLIKENILSDNDGRIKLIRTTLQDITERSRAEDAQREITQRLSLASRAGGIGIWELDVANNNLIWDDQMFQLYGITAKKFGGTYDAWRSGVHPEDLQQGEAELQMALRGEKEFDTEFRVVWPDGSIHNIRALALVKRDASGQPTSLIGANYDITKQRLVEEEIKKFNQELEQRVVERTEQLESANKELESFSYSVSHDLRTPLRGIDGFSRILLEDYSEKFDNEGQRLLNIIRSNTQKMGHLIDDLLAFSRIGRRELAKSEIDMKTLANSIYHEVTSDQQREKILFSVSNLPHTKGDAAMVRQLWTNLLSNAVKFSSKKEKPVIEISSKVENGKNVYSIRDSGVGFDMKYYDKLFGVFQRLHREDEYQGTGVGLAIAKRIVTKHGGDIWAESVANVGTTFYFIL